MNGMSDMDEEIDILERLIDIFTDERVIALLHDRGLRPNWERIFSYMTKSTVVVKP